MTTAKDKVRVETLTGKQELFAQSIASGKSSSHAYREAGYAAQNPKTIGEEASKLRANPKVSTRVDELQAQMAASMTEDVIYEYSEAMNELDDAITFAKSNGHSAAVVAALNLKQKISGLHVEDRKNDRNPVSAMSIDRVKAALEGLQAMRKMKQLA